MFNGICSKILKNFLFLLTNKMLAIMQGWNSQNACQQTGIEGPEQTISEAVCLGLHCLSWPF